MVLAVIFAQRWKVIDAERLAGTMSCHVAARVVGPCKRQVLALAVRSEGTRPGRRSVGGNTRFPCRFTRHSLLKIPSRGLAGARMARQRGLLDRMGLLLPHAHVGWREPGYAQSDTSSQPHPNVRVCCICITSGSARTPPNAGTGRRWPA